MLRWIALDAVGTLIHPEPDVAHAYAQIGRKYGSRLTASDVQLRFRSVFEHSTKACLPVDDGHIVTSEELEMRRWQWIVERVLPDVVDPLECFSELYQHFGQPAHWKVYDDVGPVLVRLRRAGYRLALASNFDQRLQKISEKTPGFDVFEQIVVSTAVGYCKPSSRFYEGLLTACDCRPEELVMIGDDPEADVAGPAQLGIRGLLLDRHATAGLTSLLQLPDLLREPLR